MKIYPTIEYLREYAVNSKRIPILGEKIIPPFDMAILFKNLLYESDKAFIYESKKGTKQWARARVHPEIKLSSKFGPNLVHPINHYFVGNVSELIKKFNIWSSLRALDIIESSKKDTLRRNIRRVFSRFIKNYFNREGYKEGKIGIILAILAGLFPLFSYLKAEIKKQNID